LRYLARTPASRALRIKTNNDEAKPFVWSKTADDILSEHREIVSANF
jgi:hypothetical protein